MHLRTKNNNNKKGILAFIGSLFYKFETKNRIFLSRHKFLYALIAGAGVVLYWRGIWHSVDYLESQSNEILKIVFSPVGTLILGVLILSLSGVLVQELVGSDVIISGLKKERRDIDKTEEELVREVEEQKRDAILIKEIDSHLHDLQKEINKK